ncbi:MAG: fused DSP-PTPase phosphatase/NAD kinase-like protein [Terriglobales bacterium]
MGFALSLSAQQTLAHPSQNVASAAAVKLKQPGLPNFGRVNQRLYRGGQPEPEGYDALRKLGVGIVVNFNTSEEGIREERAEVESRGMRYVSIPWSPRSLPRREQVAEFFRLLRENPDAEIFVHCRRGADRTGVMLAAYRMAIDGWTPEQALTEMERFKFHGFWYRHLKRYVRAFPALLESDPGLISDAQPTALPRPSTPPPRHP